MTQFFVPVETSIGSITGRDAIHLDAVDLGIYPHRLVLRGEVRGENRGWHRFTLAFEGLLAIEMMELDFIDEVERDCFLEVRNSGWLAGMRARDHSAKVHADHRHFVLLTYDNRFSLVCRGFELVLDAGTME